MMKKNSVQECNEQLIRDFKLDPSEYPVPFDLQELRNRVRNIVEVLMDSNFEKLLLILYRIDVDEEEVKKVLALGKPGDIASELADMIIEREFQKVETRRKYSQ